MPVLWYKVSSTAAIPCHYWPRTLEILGQTKVSIRGETDARNPWINGCQSPSMDECNHLRTSSPVSSRSLSTDGMCNLGDNLDRSWIIANLNVDGKLSFRAKAHISMDKPGIYKRILSTQASRATRPPSVKSGLR